MTHLSHWPEETWLAYFYGAVRDGADRIELLKQLADVRLEHPRAWDRRAVENEFANVKVRLTSEYCFCCLSAERHRYWHHIIQVQHGGSSSPSNLVSVCLRCHRAIHPWLPSETSCENRFGWTSASDITKHVANTLVHIWKLAQQRFAESAGKAK